MSDPQEQGDIIEVITAYRDARRRQDALTKEANDVAERLERLAHGLSAHPAHVMFGQPDDRIEDSGEWDIMPAHPLPSIDHLIVLTDAIRAVSTRVDELRERLVLMGHPELLDQPNGFFH